MDVLYGIILPTKQQISSDVLSLNVQGTPIMY